MLTSQQIKNSRLKTRSFWVQRRCSDFPPAVQKHVLETPATCPEPLMSVGSAIGTKPSGICWQTPHKLPLHHCGDEDAAVAIRVTEKPQSSPGVKSPHLEGERLWRALAWSGPRSQGRLLSQLDPERLD